MTVKTPEPPAPPDELAALLRRMRLPYLRGAAPEVLATARSQRWDPAEVLRVLLVEEVAGRDRATRAQRRKAAGLPAGKTFDSWRPEKSSIPAATQDALRTLEWVGRAENLAICGPSGSGKSHFCEAIARGVIDAGMRVSWFSFESLTATIGRAKVDASIARVVTRICRAELVMIDDTGMLPPPGSTRPKRSTGSSTPPTNEDPWPSPRTSTPPGSTPSCPKTIATAAVDRLLHHAHLVATDGPSVRLEEALAGTGVKPLQ